MISERQFHVTGQFQRASMRGSVSQGYTADFGILLRGDNDLHGRFKTGVPAVKFGTIRRK